MVNNYGVEETAKDTSITIASFAAAVFQKTQNGCIVLSVMIQTECLGSARTVLEQMNYQKLRLKPRPHRPGNTGTHSSNCRGYAA